MANGNRRVEKRSNQTENEIDKEKKKDIKKIRREKCVAWKIKAKTHNLKFYGYFKFYLTSKHIFILKNIVYCKHILYNFNVFIDRKLFAF